MLACAPAGPPPGVVSHSAAGTALVGALGLADRLVDPADASRPAPRLALLAPRGKAPGADLAAPAIRVDPRSFEGVFSLARRIGDALGERERAERWIRETRTSLAAISAASLGTARPHVAAVVGFEPLLVAGGASLETELIEIAGAESVTHGGAEHRVARSELPPEHREPDLWLVVSAAPADAARRERARRALPAGTRIAHFTLPGDWLADPVAAAARLRAELSVNPGR